MTNLAVRTPLDIPHEWKLSDLYKSLNDPQIEQDLQALQQKTVEFRQQYRGQVSQLTPEEMARCLQHLEAILEKSEYLYAFPCLILCTDPRNTQAKQFLDNLNVALTRINNQLMFFELELQDLDSTKLEELQTSPALKTYSYYLKRISQFHAHNLPEEVEQTRNRDKLTGRQALVELYWAHRGEQDYEAVEIPDGVAVTETELEALLFHPNASVRYDAYHSLRHPMQQHNLLYGSMLHTIAQDHRFECQMRGYPSTFYKQLLTSDLPESLVESVKDDISDRVDLFQHYYQLKGEALGQKIRTCDLYGPWSEANVLPVVDYRTGVETLITALEQFDVFYANRAEEFFSNYWVDAKVRLGKRSNAFCFPIAGKHSYLSVSYTKNYYSLLTLAHAIGQGMQFALSCDRHTYFNSKPPLMLTDVAANFNKLLLLNYLINQADNDTNLKKTLLALQVEEQLRGLFHYSTLSSLELVLHERAAQSSFDHNFINQQWLELYRQLCGDAVEILPEHQYDWARMSDIYSQPFSSHQRTIAHIVSLACYQKYQENGRDFVPNYLDLLAAGGSLSPIDALRQYIDVDLEDPATIKSAFDYVEHLIKQLQKLT